jgi:hypothetical protein
MEERPSAAIAGDTNAAAEKMSAIAQAENRRGDCIRIPDISPSLFEPPLYSRREKVTNSGAKIRAQRVGCICRCRGDFADVRAPASPGLAGLRSHDSDDTQTRRCMINAA